MLNLTHKKKYKQKKMRMKSNLQVNEQCFVLQNNRKVEK